MMANKHFASQTAEIFGEETMFYQLNLNSCEIPVKFNMAAVQLEFWRPL